MKTIKTAKDISVYSVPGLLNNKKHDRSIREYTIEEVAEIVAKHTGVPVATMKMKTGKSIIVKSRHIVGYICNKLLQKPYSQNSIGLFFMKDHASINYGNRIVKNLMETEKEFRYKTMLIFQELNL